MGVVYLAHDKRLNRRVALKVLPAELTASRDRKRRFLQEARTAGSINHPAIAQIYDVDEDDEVTFIAMERVEGKTVRELVDSVQAQPDLALHKPAHYRLVDARHLANRIARHIARVDR